MSRSRISLFAAAFAAAGLLAFQPVVRAGSADESDFTQNVRPLLETYCFECHANGKKKGGVALDSFSSADSASKDPKTWQAVLDNVKSGDMPPDDEDKQQKLDERERLCDWIERSVFAIDPAHPDPGRVTLRRLNRAEYNRTIHVLVGVDYEPANDFPADDSGYGFDDIGDVLTVPPVLFERYLAAAEKVMSLAILNDHKPRSQTIKADLTTISGGPDKGNTSTARRVDERESKLEINCPLTGVYTVRVEALAPKLGNESTKLEFKCDGNALLVPSFVGERDVSQTLLFPMPIKAAGKHHITLRVANPLASP